MNTKKLILVGLGAVALYYVWKKYGNTPTTTIITPTPEVAVIEEPATQGEIFNEKFSASGNRVPRTSKMAVHPCFCNGNFIGYTSKSGCRKACRKDSKYDINK